MNSCPCALGPHETRWSDPADTAALGWVDPVGNAGPLDRCSRCTGTSPAALVRDPNPRTLCVDRRCRLGYPIGRSSRNCSTTYLLRFSACKRRLGCSGGVHTGRPLHWHGRPVRLRSSDSRCPSVGSLLHDRLVAAGNRVVFRRLKTVTNHFMETIYSFIGGLLWHRFGGPLEQWTRWPEPGCSGVRHRRVPAAHAGSSRTSLTPTSTCA